MICTHAQQNLKAYLDRELDWWHRARLRLHLAACPACRAELEATKMASDEMKAVPTPEHDDATCEAVLAAAREQRPTRIEAATRRLRSLMAAGVGAAVLVGLALFLLLRPAPAQAALEKVIAAAGQVKSMHMRMVLEQPADSGYREIRELWYQDGKQRHESTLNGKLTDVQVFDGKKLHVYAVDTNTVYLNVSDQAAAHPSKGFTVADMLEQQQGAEVEKDTATDKQGR